MQLQEFKDYSVHCLNNRWFLRKPSGMHEVSVGLSSYLKFLPILEFDPTEFIKKLESFYRHNPAVKKFPMEDIVKFAIRHDREHWLSLAVSWIPLLSASKDLINTIKATLVNMNNNNKSYQNLLNFVVDWNRSNTKLAYACLCDDERFQKKQFIKVLEDLEIDFIEVSDIMIVVNGMKFQFPKTSDYNPPFESPS